MAIIYLRKGDLFDGDSPDDTAYVITVNCKGVMGKGIALACKQRYPEVFRRYKAQCDRGLWKPGMCAYMEARDGTRLLLVSTKEEWRYHSRYEWVESCLNKIAEAVDRYDLSSVTLPHLGCGNGGLDRDRVRRMTDDLLGHCLVDLYLYF